MSIIDDMEKASLTMLHAWGETPVAVPQWINGHAAAQPEAPAVVTVRPVEATESEKSAPPHSSMTTSTVTWGELATRMDAAAARLTTLGVRPGDRVAVLVGNTVAFYEAFLGAARIGAVFVPLNVSSAAPELSHIIEDSEPRIIVCDAELTSLVAATGVPIADAATLSTPPGPTPSGGDPTPPLPIPPTPDDLVAILYTSGTTGRPKGAEFTHTAFWTTAVNQRESLGLTSADRHLIVSPLAFTGGILTSTQPALMTGGTILLEDGFDPSRLLARMATEAPTVFMAVPAMLKLLIDHPAFDPTAFTSLRYLGSGSAPVPLPLFEQYRALGINIGHAYGLTEGGGLTTQLTPSSAAAHPGSAGQACCLTEIRVVDTETGEAVAPGRAGELQQRGPSTFLGYWRNPDATTETLDEGWLRTGDLATIDADGYLTIVGRSKDVIITGGMNVYPAEVESVISQIVGVSDVAVVGVAHPIYGETVVAVIRPHPGAAVTFDAVREHCRAQLADYKVPRRLEILDEFPRTASGKVLKRELRDTLDNT